MAYNADGKWEFENDSVETRVSGMLKADSPLMQAATTQGAKTANQRGLMNSTMAQTASLDAMTKAALPIASQDASNIAAKNLSRQQTTQQMEVNAPQLQNQKDIAAMNVAAHDRQYTAAALTELQKKYGAMFTEIAKNNDLNATARNNYYAHLSALRDTDINFLEQIYGVDFDWTPAVATHTT